MNEEFLIFSGTANPLLSAAIARELGVPLGRCVVDRFPDGELSVRLLESVRRKEVFVIQGTEPPVNENLMELLVFADVCRRSAAGRITAVVPYYGYARADKRHGRREPITASLAASLLETAGIDHLLTVDLHTTQIEGFFQIPVDTLTAVPTLCAALRDRLPTETTVVSPDAGRVPLATRYAARLGLPVAVLHKRRESGSRTQVTHLVGEVMGRTCLLVDDMISTGGTLVESVAALRDAGAQRFVVAATHGLLLRDARKRLADAGVDDVFVTDSVAAGETGYPLEVVSIAPMLAQAIGRFVARGSLNELF